MERRLPVYLVVDASFSMRGQTMEALRRGIDGLVADLRADPQAIETAWLGLITFATGADTVVPLTDILQFRTPALVASGRSDLGAGIHELIERLGADIRRNSDQVKGDWRPIVFLMTDGGPSDAWITQAKALRAMQDRGEVTVVAVGFGSKVHKEVLVRLSPVVVISDSREPDAFGKFLAWVSTSVSASVRTGGSSLDSSALPLPKGFVRVRPSPSK
jgi:uncharacterized protein YegL